MKKLVISTLLAAVLAIPAVGFAQPFGDHAIDRFQGPTNPDHGSTTMGGGDPANSYDNRIGGDGGLYDSGNIRNSGNVTTGRGGATGPGASSSNSGNTTFVFSGSSQDFHTFVHKMPSNHTEKGPFGGY